MTANIEKRIANKLVRAALAKGYTICVYEGEDYALKRSKKEREIEAALGSTDSDTLILRNEAGERVGSVLLIWGNGEDVISDHTDNAAINELVNGLN
jgi:hypothetical protein